MAKFDLPRGTRDFLPTEMIVRNHVEAYLRATVAQYGFQQIQTPIFEQFELLAARSGEEIRESLFTFASDAGRYALRPELTSPVCRLMSTNVLSDLTPPYKLYYFGPCFRYCRPQAGRYREFYQAGVELMGSEDPLADAEVIALAVRILQRLGIPDWQLCIGDVGVFRRLLEEEGLTPAQQQDRQNRVLSDIDKLMHIREKCDAMGKSNGLSMEEKSFLETANRTIRRLQDEIGFEEKLDNFSVSANVDDQQAKALAAKLPDVAEETVKQAWISHRTLSKDKANLLIEVYRIRGNCDEVMQQASEKLKGTTAMEPLEELRRVCEWLPLLGVTNYEVVLGTARNLDFYTGTVFEIYSPKLGVKKQLCGGGRYDRLVEEFEGPSTPATGFAFGFDRLVEAFKASGHEINVSPVDAVIIGSASVRLDVVKFAESLRVKGLRVSTPLQELDLADQLKYCDQIQSPLAVEIGSGGQCKVYDRRAGSEQTVEQSEVITLIQQNIAKGA